MVGDKREKTTSNTDNTMINNKIISISFREKQVEKNVFNMPLSPCAKSLWLLLHGRNEVGQEDWLPGLGKWTHHRMW